jgi:hypothetical protein
MLNVQYYYLNETRSLAACLVKKRRVSTIIYLNSNIFPNKTKNHSNASTCEGYTHLALKSSKKCYSVID